MPKPKASPSGEKSKRGGSCRPFGKHALGSLKESKKGCAQASNYIKQLHEK